MDITEVPTKCVRYMRALHVQAQVQFIDFEGRSDGESIQKILAGLKPRRLVLVRGSPESTLALEAHAKLRIPDARIFAPSRGEVVDATTETHIYQVTEMVQFLVTQKPAIAVNYVIDLVAQFIPKNIIFPPHSL